MNARGIAVSRPCYFTVERILGRQVPKLYWDDLPRTPIRGLEYVVRLDQLPNGSLWQHRPLKDLLAVYQHLKRLRKLPPRWEGA